MRRIIYHEVGSLRHVLADPTRKPYLAWDARIKTGMNDSGELQATLCAENPTTPLLSAMRSEIVVENDGVELWRGRLIEPVRELGGRVSIVAKGCLDYLHDTTLQQQTLSGSAREIFANIISQHNAKPIEANKKFALGSIDDMGSIDVFKVKAGEKTWDIIAKLIKQCGGLIRTQRVDGKNYLYWQKESSYVCSQEIRFGHNLLGIKESLQTDRLASVMYAYGRTTDGVALGIEAVNDGASYVCDEEAIALFGWIEDSYVDPSCEDAGILKGSAENELASRLREVRTITATAIDLSDITDVERIEAGMQVRALMPGFDEVVQCSSMERYLFEPMRTNLSFGASMRAISNMIGGIVRDV